VDHGALGFLGQPTRGPGTAGDWFMRAVALRRLRPVCQISYQRTARVAVTGGGSMRLTMDDHVRVTPSSQLAFADAGGTPVVDERFILELKYSGDMPAAFTELVRTFALVPQAASKYRLGVVALGYMPGLSRQ